jgi:hypothetical protein
MLHDQIVKLAWGEKESSWWIPVDDHSALYADTRRWAAIASKNDGMAFPVLVVMHGFEKFASCPSSYHNRDCASSTVFKFSRSTEPCRLR